MRVRTGARAGYDVVVCDTGLDELVARVSRLVPGPRVVLFSDSRVMALHGKGVRGAFHDTGRDVVEIVVPPGERSKTVLRASLAWDRLVEASIDRNTPLIALGGGVVGDLGGFVAATYLRGIPLIQVPTTLLALVDSSVGGKTAVDHALGKNLIGAFYQPRLVFASLEVLATLPRREYRAGLAEIVKAAVLGDAELFEDIERSVDAIERRDAATLRRLVTRAVRVKARVVERDPTERGVRACLNLGHTLGHAIEQLDGYRGLRHGEAVAVGLAAAARFSLARGWLRERAAARICELLRALGLPTSRPGLDASAVAVAIRRDKKVVASSVRFVAPTAIGRTAFRSIAVEELARGLVTAVA